MIAIDPGNEDSDDGYMPELGVRNHEDIDSSGDEKEGKDIIPSRGPIARKKTVILKDSDARLDDKYHKVTGVND